MARVRSRASRTLIRPFSILLISAHRSSIERRSCEEIFWRPSAISSCVRSSASEPRAIYKKRIASLLLPRSLPSAIFEGTETDDLCIWSAKAWLRQSGSASQRLPMSTARSRDCLHTFRSRKSLAIGGFSMPTFCQHLSDVHYCLSGHLYPLPPPYASIPLFLCPLFYARRLPPVTAGWRSRSGRLDCGYRWHGQGLDGGARSAPPYRRQVDGGRINRSGSSSRARSFQCESRESRSTTCGGTEAAAACSCIRLRSGDAASSAG